MGRSNLIEASPNEARALFHNSRTIGLACERRDGDGQQLARGGPRMSCCRWPLWSWQSFSLHSDLGGVHQKSFQAFLALPSCINHAGGREHATRAVTDSVRCGDDEVLAGF